MNNKNTNQIVKMIYLILQIGLAMLTAVFMCIGLAYLVDRWFGKNLMVWFILLGVVSGFRAAYILIRRFVSFDNPDDEFLSVLKQEEEDEEEDEHP